MIAGGVAMGSVGLPVAPAGLAGGAFPCQGHGCGCRTAADCWLGCCCMTPGQRLSWAKKHGVTPPAELVELAEVEAPKALRRSCCAGHGEGVCRKDAGSRKSCCNEKATKADSDDSESRFARSRCRGFGGSWVTIGQPLGLPEKPAAVTAGGVREPVVVAAADYVFFLGPPPTRPG